MRSNNPASGPPVFVVEETMFLAHAGNGRLALRVPAASPVPPDPGQVCMAVSVPDLLSTVRAPVSVPILLRDAPIFDPSERAQLHREVARLKLLRAGWKDVGRLFIAAVIADSI